MALKKKTTDRYFNTVWAICASRYVNRFMIGFTARSGAASLARHARYGFQYLVVIADKLTRKDALDLEEILRDRILKTPKHLMCKKYVESRKKAGH